MQTRTLEITTAVFLITGAVLANVAFVGLGSAFDYPQILKQPTDVIFQKFTAHQGAISFWFVLLALGAGLIAPIAIFLSRLFPGRLSRLMMFAGIAASVVQVTGLMRWPLIVPGFIASGNVEMFEFFHDILGTFVGETLGYFFTGAWTILVSRNIAPQLAGSWFASLGTLSAGLILSGIFIPGGLPGLEIANFIGYVLWSVWMIIFGVLLLRRGSSPVQETN